MSLYLTQAFSAWGLTLLLILAACAYAIGLMLGTRLLYGVDRLSLNNEVAGFKFAVIGVFYAVLLAFVVVGRPSICIASRPCCRARSAPTSAGMSSRM